MRLNAEAESLLARMPIQILGLSLSVALALGGIALALTRNSDTGQQVRTMSAAPTSTTSTTSPAAPTRPPLAPGAPPESPASPPAAAAPDGANPGSLSGDAFVFTPAVVEPPATPSPPQTSTPVALCTPAQVEEALITDKVAYSEGEVVNVTATVVNRSTSTCAVVDPDSDCYSLLSAYDTAGNRPFWRSGDLPIVPCQTFPRRPLTPGMGAELRGTWDQLDRRECPPSGGDPLCTQPRVPGAYTIRSSWLAQVVSTPIELL